MDQRIVRLGEDKSRSRAIEVIPLLSMVRCGEEHTGLVAMVVGFGRQVRCPQGEANLMREGIGKVVELLMTPGIALAPLALLVTCVNTTKIFTLELVVGNDRVTNLGSNKKNG